MISSGGLRTPIAKNCLPLPVDFGELPSSSFFLNPWKSKENLPRYFTWLGRSLTAWITVYRVVFFCICSDIYVLPLFLMLQDATLNIMKPREPIPQILHCTGFLIARGEKTHSLISFMVILAMVKSTLFFYCDNFLPTCSLLSTNIQNII